jgi:hypothetical protein
MQLKLDLVQQQLSGKKFEQIAKGGVGNTIDGILRSRFSKDMDEESVSDQEMAQMPYLRKKIKGYDPEEVRKEEKELEKKRQQLEKTEKDLDLFQEFTEEEQKEIEKLDRLTRFYLFIRRYMTNPIIS